MNRVEIYAFEFKSNKDITVVDNHYNNYEEACNASETLIYACTMFKQVVAEEILESEELDSWTNEDCTYVSGKRIRTKDVEIIALISECK